MSTVALGRTFTILLTKNGKGPIYLKLWNAMAQEKVGLLPFLSST